MGHIILKNGADGQEFEVDEDATVEEVRTQMNLSPDFMLVNSEGKRIEGKIKDQVQDGETVMPLVQPRYGQGGQGPPPIFSPDINFNRVMYYFNKLKEVFPDAKITDDGRFILIPYVKLDKRKFNADSTPMLIGLTRRFLLFGRPGIYVSRKLKVYGRRSRHLDEALTEPEMLDVGYVKLCWYNPPNTANLIQLISNAILFLDKLVR